MENNQAEKQENIAFLDALRVLAITLVLLMHVITGVTTNSAYQMEEGMRHIYEGLQSLASVGVPLFFMISGALLLSPKKEISLESLWKKYIRRIVLAIVIFGTGFALAELIVTYHDFHLQYLVLALLMMVCGNTWAHMWYLYALLGLYLLLPMLKAFTAHVNRKTLGYILLVLFTVNVALPLITQFTGIGFGLMFPVAGVYLFYYLAGFFLISGEIRIPKLWLALMGLLMIVFQFLNCFLNWQISVDYDSIFVVILSLTVFALVQESACDIHCFRMVRPYIFGMYLIHTLFLNVAYKLLFITPLACGGYILIPVFVAGTWVLSLAAAWVMKKIPVLGKYVM